MGTSAAGRTVFLHEYVTGGGLAGQALLASLAAEGGAMRRALLADFAAVPDVRVWSTLDARFAAEPGPWEVVRVAPGTEEATVRRLAARADATLIVAPETDGLLAERARWVRESGGHGLGSSADAIELTASKARFEAHLVAHGIRTPPTLELDLARDGLPDRLLFRRVVPRGPDGVADPNWPGALSHDGDRSPRAAGADPVEPPDRGHARLLLELPYPAVVKPHDGAGCVDTWLVDRPAARPPGFPDRGLVVVQPHVPGTPLSASYLVGADGTPHLVGVGRQHVGCAGGRFTYLGGTVPHGEPALAAEAARTVATVPGLAGWVGVDFLWEPARGAVILELNPRLTTSYVGLRRLLAPGVLASAWLAAFEAPATLAGFDLAGRVHAGRPRTFAPDGTFAAGVSAP